MEDAVNAVLDLELFLERLDVDVARPVADGAREDEVDEVDDGRLAGDLAQVADLGAGDGLAFLGALEVLDHALDREAVESLDRRFHVALGADGADDALAGEDADVVHGLEVERVRHGQDEAAVFLGHGNDAGLLDQFRRDASGRARGDLGFGEVEEADMQRARERRERLPLIGPAEGHQAFAQALAAAAELLERLVHLRFGNFRAHAAAPLEPCDCENSE